MSIDPNTKTLRLLNIERRVEEMFSELIHQPWGRTPPAEHRTLAVDIYETDEAYLIEADLPGVLPEAVQLEFIDRRVVLRGSRGRVQWLKAGRGIRLEREQGEFLRVLEFDEPIDVSRVEKHFEHGLLRVRLPKLKHLNSDSSAH